MTFNLSELHLMYYMLLLVVELARWRMRLVVCCCCCWRDSVPRHRPSSVPPVCAFAHRRHPAATHHVFSQFWPVGPHSSIFHPVRRMSHWCMMCLTRSLASSINWSLVAAGADVSGASLGVVSIVLALLLVGARRLLLNSALCIRYNITVFVT